MDGQQSVLIVDSAEETREVLRTALERRGLRILSADRAGRGLELARQHHPDLIVLDLEMDDAAADAVAGPLAEHSREDQAPMVVLGSLRRRNPLPDGEFVCKPYHYAPLIRKIEEMLAERAQSS